MKIESLPRVPLATLPTPLDDAPRLSNELDVRVLIKRDDLTGFALGGKKARKLEFLIADALEKKADVVITGGGPQSNHTRTTAAAARRVGMDATLVLSGDPPGEVNRNLLLDQILGAEIRYTHSTDRRCRTETALGKLARLRQRVQRFQPLSQVLKALFSANVEKALTFLDDRLLGLTSNAVERGNRRYRKMQKTVYRVRTYVQIVARLALDLFREAAGQPRTATLDLLHAERASPCTGR